MASSVQEIVAVIGAPVAGNPTQFVMERALRQSRLEWQFLTLEVSRESLGDAIRGIRAMGFLGASVADPHQPAAAEFLDEVSETARFSGAVNCIRRQENLLIGENTVGQAVLDCIRALGDPQAKRAVLLGAGNSELAIAVELAKAGAASVILLHLPGEPLDENAVSHVQALSTAIQLVQWSEQFSLDSTDILVSATGTSSSKNKHCSKLNLDALPSTGIIADLEINPADTELLRKTRTRGCRTIDGLQILVSQLAANFQLWTGARPDTVVMREALEEFLEF